jgi:hypothetical protein
VARERRTSSFPLRMGKAISFLLLDLTFASASLLGGERWSEESNEAVGIRGRESWADCFYRKFYGRIVTQGRVKYEYEVRLWLCWRER